MDFRLPQFGRQTARAAGFHPQPQGHPGRFDTQSLPPAPLVAGAVRLTVMNPAQRNSEFVADLVAQSSPLCESEVMGIGRLASADEAGLGRDEPQVRLVAEPLEFANWKHTLVDRTPMRLRPADSGRVLKPPPLRRPRSARRPR